MKKICICDDDQDIVDVFAHYLKESNYQVYKCYDGQAVIDLFKVETIDLLIIDIMMPKLDGISTVIQLRQNHVVPIIFYPQNQRKPIRF